MYQKYTTRLVRENDLIVLENLRLANMSRRNKPVPDPLHEGGYLPNGQAAKHGLNRSLRRASMGRLASMLAYKTKLAEGVGMILVNPAYTSQTCSRCGHVDKKKTCGARTAPRSNRDIRPTETLHANPWQPLRDQNLSHRQGWEESPGFSRGEDVKHQNMSG